MDFAHSPKCKELLDRVKAFMAAEVAPVEATYLQDNLALNAGSDWKSWKVLPAVRELKVKARAQGLWNLFLPQQMSTLDYAPIAEETGRSLIAPEVFNCNAPDTGNMEVLLHYGTPAQQEEWLEPLLDARIRSVFCMTEPGVASSDATNMEATIREDGDRLILNGHKWWATGLGHPDAKLAIFMGLSNPEGPRYSQHSMVLVPLDAPGVTITRMLPTFGDYDPPYGHGELRFDDVVVPKSNLLVGLGQGFAIAQGRLGPGRIHHCMRTIGAAERALELLIQRGLGRVAFGKPLLQLGGNMERVADLRMAIDQARLLTLFAAWKIAEVGIKEAMVEISAIKVVAPNVLQRVVDEAIQIYGGAGMSHDTPLTSLFMIARALRIADGPDAVHRSMVARLEVAKHAGGSPRGGGAVPPLGKK